jgi:hypothetical protein
VDHLPRLLHLPVLVVLRYILKISAEVLPTIAVNIPTRTELVKAACPGKIIRKMLFRTGLFSGEKVVEALDKAL